MGLKKLQSLVLLQLVLLSIKEFFGDRAIVIVIRGTQDKG